MKAKTQKTSSIIHLPSVFIVFACQWQMSERLMPLTGVINVFVKTTNRSEK